MTPIINIPPEWIFVYVIGTYLVVIREWRKSEGEISLCAFYFFLYNLSLTIGLRLYYS